MLSNRELLLLMLPIMNLAADILYDGRFKEMGKEVCVGGTSAQLRNFFQILLWAPQFGNLSLDILRELGYGRLFR